MLCVGGQLQLFQVSHLAYFVSFICIDVSHLLTSDCLICDLNFDILLLACNLSLGTIHN